MDRNYESNKVFQTNRSDFMGSGQGSTQTHSQRVFKSLAPSIDLTFNSIKEVKKVSWKDSAPWFREIEDGFCWVAYCKNKALS